MADKTYKMQVTLTDNRVLDAGTFVSPQGPQGPEGESGNAIYFVNAYIDAETTDVLLSDIEIIAGRNIQINDILMSSYLDSQGAIAKVTAINENIINIVYIGTFTGVGVKSISITEV